MQVSQMVDIAMATALVSFTISVLIVYSVRWHGGHSLDHDLDGVQKYHTTAVPRVGGLAVIAGIFCALAFFIILFPGQITTSDAFNAMLLLIASMPAFIAGIIEDVTKKVSARVRLVASFTSALLASVLLSATVDQLNIWGVDSLLVFAPIALVVTAVVVAGGVNAVNIIDGFNGLSGSVVIIMTAALGILAWQAGDVFVVTLAVLGGAAALGFLLVNFPTGRIFLGDGGAYFLGFWVSEIAVLLLARNPSVNAWQVLSICAYPVIEVLYSIYRRKFIQKARAGDPDALHMHTIVYRRVAVKLIPKFSGKPWIRNSIVTCIIVPWIGIMAIISVLVGGTVISGITLVIAQVFLYVAAYSRLARGLLSGDPADGIVRDRNANAELL